MICAACRDGFDETRQSAACPHPGLKDTSSPIGGVRLLPEQKREIDEAFRVHDTDTLWRMLSHGNRAVRVYAGQMYDLLEAQDQALAATPTDSVLDLGAFRLQFGQEDIDKTG